MKVPDSWMEKIKKVGMGKLIIVVIAGVLLVMISWQGSGSDSEPEVSKQKSATQAESSMDSQEAYRISMEKKVASVLSNVQGVGKTKVMITLQASREKVPLKDNERSGNDLKEDTVLTEKSDNSTSPYVLQEKEAVVEGIVIVCGGGGDENVRQEIITAVQVLFNVEVHKIKVMKMQS